MLFNVILGYVINVCMYVFGIFDYSLMHVENVHICRIMLCIHYTYIHKYTHYIDIIYTHVCVLYLFLFGFMYIYIYIYYAHVLDSL